MSGNKNEEKQLMIIDTDCGTDDALAILLALSFKDRWQILAITCCFGNTTVDNACNNVMKVLYLCDEEKIPVYRGCNRSLLWETPSMYGDQVHGADGLGNVSSEFSSGNLKVSRGHAANELVRLAKENSKQVTLVAIGPLTNLALAHRLDPEFTENLKSIVLMGGNIYGIGNTTPAAEFNFGADPESAHIVMSEASCLITMIPWETTTEHGMDWDLFQKLKRIDTKKAHFVKRTNAQRKNRKGKLMDCDFLAVAALVFPESITATISCPVAVETNGKFSRGLAVIDRLQHSSDDGQKKRNIINIVTHFNDADLDTLRNQMVVN